MSYINQRYSKRGWAENGSGEKFFTDQLYIDGNKRKKKISMKPKISILFFTANNLYGHAQSRPMPVSDYRWLDEKAILELDWMKMTEDQNTGYIVEVDLVYPSHLHFEHNSFPLAPERLHIKREMLSPYAQGESFQQHKIK